jgi:hypothetical protein
VGCRASRARPFAEVTIAGLTENDSPAATAPGWGRGSGVRLQGGADHAQRAALAAGRVPRERRRPRDRAPTRIPVPSAPAALIDLDMSGIALAEAGGVGTVWMHAISATAALRGTCWLPIRSKTGSRSAS